MSEVRSYKDAEEFLSHGRNPDDRPLANNTRLIHHGNSIGVVLHDTEVVTYYPDGRISLDSGGWRTVTTRDRMNNYGPLGWQVWQDRGVWYFGHGWRDPEPLVYADGITVHPDDTVTGAAPKEVAKGQEKWRRRIRTYAKDFAKEVLAGRIEAPSGGDCWHCHLVTEDGKTPLGDATENTDHLESHILGSYFVPSLLYHVLQEEQGARLSRAATDVIAASMWPEQHPDPEASRRLWGDIAERQIAKAICHYLYQRLGLAS